MMLVYRVIITLLYPLLILVIFFRRLTNKEDKERYKEKLFPSYFNISKNKKSKLIWFHAASVGEFKSIIPIIEYLNKKNKYLEFLITTVTLSSAKLAKTELEKTPNSHHRFFPVDVDFVIKKFISLWSPSAIILIDSEIWPNLIFYAKKNKIPLALINARLTKKTFKRWLKIQKFAELVFNSFDLCLASNYETKKYLEKFKAKKVFYLGNLKFIKNSSSIKKNTLNENFLTQNKIWFAASTHRGEDEFCLKVHLELKKRIKGVFTIIAPRHTDRVKEIRNLCKNFNLDCQIINKDDTITLTNVVIIINSYGELSNYYRFAKSVFIGKSMIKKLRHVGGQNPIEAARLGCKIYHGPFVYNFEEIYEILSKQNIAKKISNLDELIENLFEDLKHGEKDINSFAAFMNKTSNKTLEENMSKINEFLSNDIK